MDSVVVERIINKYANDKGGLISTLQAIQARFGYLPKKALEIVSKTTGKSLVDIYGVATFYKSFSLKPRGKHLVSVCLGTACHVLGGPKIAQEFEKVLGIKAGETTKDGEYTLETVNCLGACALGPIVVINNHYFSHAKTSKVRKILKQVKEGLDKVEFKTDKRVFPLDVSCPKCNHSLSDPDHHIDGHPGIRVTASFGKKHGWMLLSSLYGSYNVESEHEVPQDQIVNFFCPHCHAELNSAAQCPECDASVVSMVVKGGGLVQICSRSGCKGHLLLMDAEITEGEG